MFGRKNEQTAKSRRVHPRAEFIEACIVRIDGRALRGKTMNISEAGMAIQLQSMGTVKDNAKLTVHLDHVETISGRVRWVKGRSFGIELEKRVDEFPTLVQRVAAAQEAAEA